MYSFLRRPAWIVSHVLVAVGVVVMILLGFWQRDRWIEERDEKERLDTVATAAPVPFDDLVPPVAGHGGVDDDELRYRRVVVRGTYDLEAEVAVLNRSHGGAPGAWVLTPLVRDGGDAVAVVRGWIPYEDAQGDAPFEVAAPPGGTVTVTGNLQPTQRRGSVGPIDPEEGQLDRLNRVDLERLDQQFEGGIAPMWVLLDGQDPAQAGRFPALIELQRADPSQNFSYMVQWWIFAAIAAGGYPLVLRAVARNRARGDVSPIDDPADELVAGG